MKLTRRDFLKLSGLLGLAPLIGDARPSRGAVTPAGETPPPNILLFVFDTLSARHMSLYGYPRETTPHLTLLAAKANVYHRHYAGGSFTTAGTATLLTGTYPWTHRAFHLYGSVEKSLAGHNLFAGLAGHLPVQTAYTHNPLAQVLLEQCHASQKDLRLLPMRELMISANQYSQSFPHDYEAAFAGEGVARKVDDPAPPAQLLLSVFDYFRQISRIRMIDQSRHDMFPAGVPRSTHGAFFTVEDVVDWLIPDLAGRVSPGLTYIHLYPPHEPYLPRQEFHGRFREAAPPAEKPRHHFATPGLTQAYLNQTRAQYDDFIAYVDAEFGRLMAGLESAGVLENTIVVLTSDHGQMFERGIHGHVTPVLYEPLIHIPLLIWLPGQLTRRDVHALTSAVDVMPTLAQLAGGMPPAWGEGQPLPGPGDPVGERAVFAMDAKENSKFAPLLKGTFAMLKGQYKIVKYLGYDGFAGQTESYDLETDPEELVNLGLGLPAFQKMEQELAAKINAINLAGSG